MKRLLALSLSAIALSAGAAHADFASEQLAFFSSGTTVSVASVGCPYLATQNLDGCANAPPYINSSMTFQNTNLAIDTTNGFFQSAQVVTYNLGTIGYNMAGRVYATGIRLNGPYTTVINGKTVVGAYCNDTSGVLVANKVGCSLRAGYEGLADPTIYDWAHDPAGWGCVTSTSGYDATKLQSTCFTPTTNVHSHIQGVDLNANGSCTTLYVVPTFGATTTGTVELSDFYQKIDATIGSGGVNGCTNPFRAAPIKIDDNLQNYDVTIDYGITDHNQYVLHGDLDNLFIRTGGKATVHYIHCSNATARCAGVTTCDTQDTSFNTVLGIGNWPDGVHFEFSLYYNLRILDNSCQPNQIVKNQTSITPSVTHGPAVTSAISTGEALPTHSISAGTYDSATGNIVLTLNGFTYTNNPDGIYVRLYNFGGAGAAFNDLYLPIIAHSGGNQITINTAAGLGSIAITTGSITDLSFGSLDMEYNTIGSNTVGGSPPMFSTGNNAVTVSGTNTGTYAVGDILSYGGAVAAACAIVPQVKVTTVVAGKPTAAINYNGGNCATNPATGAVASACVSGTCLTGNAGNPSTGVLLATIFASGMAGYGIQLGDAAYSGPATIAHNRIDPTGVSALGNVLFYQNTYCVGAGGSITDNLNLLDGTALTPTQRGTYPGNHCPNG